MSAFMALVSKSFLVKLDLNFKLGYLYSDIGNWAKKHYYLSFLRTKSNFSSEVRRAWLVFIFRMFVAFRVVPFGKISFLTLRSPFYYQESKQIAL
jgi:hypothetical protein